MKEKDGSIATVIDISKTFNMFSYCVLTTNA